MKKLLSLLLALAMLLGLTAFAEATVDYTGVWTLNRVETPGMTMDMSMLAQLGMNMTITINEDGTMVMTTLGVDENGTWAVTGTGISIADEEETIELTYEQDMLRMEDKEGTMLFARGEANGQSATPLQADANAASYDYVGAWVLNSVEVMGIAMDPGMVGLGGDMMLYEDGTCVLTMLDESQEGTWAVTETGIATTDADGVVDAFMLVNGQLVIEQSGMKLVFIPYAPLFGLTVADFNGEWVFESMEMYDYVQMTQGVYTAEEVGTEIALSLENGKGHLVMSYTGGKDEYDGECVVEDVAELGSVMYFLFLDENGVQDGSGLMLMMYPGDELTWFEYDQEADMDLYYNFVRFAE